MNKVIMVIMVASVVLSCGRKNVRTWSDAEIGEWYKQSEWQSVNGINPDRSVDTRLFVEQNLLNPDSWAVALKFMKETDFAAIQEGRYELSADGTYATVTDYITKDAAHFEAHRKYIDIQYVFSGEEYIQLTPLEGKVDVVSYDEAADIEFFDKDDYSDVLVSGDNFLVLFPSDGHKPCMKVNEKSPVRKIVVKIPYVD